MLRLTPPGRISSARWYSAALAERPGGSLTLAHHNGGTIGNGPLAHRTISGRTFADRTFGLVFSVRLCHHIDDYDERMRYVREILRISARSVVFTYFDTDSVKNRVHQFKRRFKPRTPKCTLTSQDIQNIADESGFNITRSTPLSRLFSGHQYTVLQRP